MSRFILLWFGVMFILTSLSSCGGGGSNGSSATSSSSKYFVSPPPFILAPDNQTFALDEDGFLEGKINLNTDHVNANDAYESFTGNIHTLKGGIIRLVGNGESTAPIIFFNYRPAEDFNGDDEADIYLTKYNDDQTAIRQKIKVIFRVRPVMDNNFKFKIINKKVFVAGDQVYLSLPYDPDDKILLPSGLNFKLSIDDLPVDYFVNAEGLSFVMPPKVLAGANNVSLEFNYSGEQVSVTSFLTSKIDYGDVEYWLGDKARPGVTYVVIAEKSIDQQAYLNWINTVFTALLSEPLVSQYSSYWNLVVIKKLAPENYAFHHSGAGTTVLVADLTGAGEAFIKKFVPNYDWVLLNTGLNGRATGGDPMVLRLSDIRTVLHEFGHVHAKLADEYADADVYGDLNYTEGSSPNVTNYNNYDAIPWKHWIIDKTKIPGVVFDKDSTRVGAFLGAYYAPNKFYRPMLNSLMRDINDPLGPVGSEAWVLATYERMGILNSVTNIKSNNVRTFNISKRWNKNLTRIDWFVNDVKQDAWVNQSSVVVDETKFTANIYTVKTELTDLLGYIKNPHAYPAFKKLNNFDSDSNNLKNIMNENFQKIWTFEKSTSASVVKLQKKDALNDTQAVINSDDWVSHGVSIQDGVHHLAESTSYHRQDTLMPVTAHSEFRADVVDTSDSRIYSIGVDNPYRYYHGETGMVFLRGLGSYKIKHPRIDGSYKIIVFNQRTNKSVLTLDFDGKN